MPTTTARRDENTAIAEAYKAMGKEVCFGKGGGWVRGEGFKTLAQLRKETGVNQATKREPRAVGGGGDWNWLVLMSKKGK